MKVLLENLTQVKLNYLGGSKPEARALGHGLAESSRFALLCLPLTSLWEWLFFTSPKYTERNEFTSLANTTGYHYWLTMSSIFFESCLIPSSENSTLSLPTEPRVHVFWTAEILLPRHDRGHFRRHLKCQSSVFCISSNPVDVLWFTCNSSWL